MARYTYPISGAYHLAHKALHNQAYDSHNVSIGSYNLLFKMFNKWKKISHVKVHICAFWGFYRFFLENRIVRQSIVQK